MRWSKRAPEGDQPWMPWFAWYPVMLGKFNEFVWLERIERCRHYPYASCRHGSFWRYRLIGGEK